MQELRLGGNIVLSGFESMDGGTMIILKKIIGNYARKFSSATHNFEQLIVSLNCGDASYSINAKLFHDGKAVASEFIDKNIFFAIDTVMKKIESSVAV